MSLKKDHSLPSSTTNENLETISRNKLALLFDPSLFELRPENQRDKGIDLIIELKQNSAYTNFRFAVQVKSTISTKKNKDGSFSYPVEVSNINYLLNYPMPAYYIIYDHTLDAFYYEQAFVAYQSLLPTGSILKVLPRYPHCGAVYVKQRRSDCIGVFHFLSSVCRQNNHPKQHYLLTIKPLAVKSCGHFVAQLWSFVVICRHREDFWDITTRWLYLYCLLDTGKSI